MIALNADNLEMIANPPSDILSSGPGSLSMKPETAKR